NFILRSDEAEYLTAPFDGYIEQVFVRPGDQVAKGGKLLSLNRSELLLDESAALADLTRYQRESEKARAAKSLAEMRIADALAQQAQARLDLVRYRLENATVKAAFAGVVVEGDLRERIASPVKQGDALYKVARLDTLYAEADVPERDVKEILGKAKGEIAFVTQPKTKYPVTIETVQPSALTKKDGNVFLVRLKLDGGAQAWWRPGMTGLCKLSVEKRSLFWILTHRTADFLRLKLWF
ncbi:MAG: efflux RND transporter periplasmic adaptor subunit, partial [Verrucomicrobiota bacterium]